MVFRFRFIYLLALLIDKGENMAQMISYYKKNKYDQ